MNVGPTRPAPRRGGHGESGPGSVGEFYRSCFGWTVDFDERPEAGGYAVATLRGKSVAGLGPTKNPVGAFVSVWQPNAHIGSEIVGEPGTFVWNELATTNIAAASDFYTTVFGWGLDETQSDDARAFTVGGEMVCGAHAAGEGEFPAWSIWFAVADCDASTAKAVELGATVLMPPNDMDFGRGAVVADPQGAVFGMAVVTDGAI